VAVLALAPNASVYQIVGPAHCVRVGTEKSVRTQASKGAARIIDAIAC